MFLGDLFFVVFSGAVSAFFSGPILALWGGLIGIPFGFINKALGI